MMISIKNNSQKAAAAVIQALLEYGASVSSKRPIHFRTAICRALFSRYTR
jgi:isopentenyl phosphate kinase